MLITLKKQFNYIFNYYIILFLIIKQKKAL